MAAAAAAATVAALRPQSTTVHPHPAPSLTGESVIGCSGLDVWGLSVIGGTESPDDVSMVVSLFQEVACAPNSGSASFQVCASIFVWYSGRSSLRRTRPHLPSQKRTGKSSLRRMSWLLHSSSPDVTVLPLANPANVVGYI